MASTAPPKRKRESIRILMKEYEEAKQAGKKEDTKLCKVIRAWAAIESDDYYKNHPYNSFWTIGGLHGAPFRGAGWGNSQWWGGYCNHGNILFPTWHRAYLWRIENALRSVPGCEDVTMPFWDEFEKETFDEGVPAIFGQEKFTYLKDGTTIDNPLHGYVFNNNVYDNISTTDQNNPFNYTKKKGYKTVRYPLSGLRDQPDQQDIDNHNEIWTPKAWGALNDNVKAWMGPKNIKGTVTAGLGQKIIKSLLVPYYTVFSNTTSAAEYNQMNFSGKSFDPEQPGRPAEVAVEDPHNGMHLAVGGFESKVSGYNVNNIERANGDMGENDTAGLDPIFFFHHCFIDLLFHKWQTLHGKTERLEIEPQFRHYPGTNSVDSQGPTPGVTGNSWLNLESELTPFTVDDLPDGPPMNSHHVTDITKIGGQGYSYGENSLEGFDSIEKLRELIPEQIKGLNTYKVSNISRANIRGSFAVTVSAKVDGEWQTISQDPVLSRRHVMGCANCQAHQSVTSFVSLPAQTVAPDCSPADLETRVRTHSYKDGITSHGFARMQIPEPEFEIGQIQA